MTWTELLTDPNTYISLLTLAAMEIILGIDNIVFITILSGRLPPEQQRRARRLGLSVAMISRLALLFAITWVMRLTEPLFYVDLPFMHVHLLDRGISGRDLILGFGGLFLIAKATHEIYENVQRPAEHHPHEIDEEIAAAAKKASNRKLMASIIFQIMLLDIVFSLDSVITAVGMANHIAIMAAAVVLAVGVMLAFAGPIGDFVQKHASIRVLALAFLILIGVLLVAESLGQHVSKGYVYFAMAFSLIIELINMRMRSRLQRIEQRLSQT